MTASGCSPVAAECSGESAGESNRLLVDRILRFAFQPVRFGWRRIAKSGCRLLEL